jgi:lipoprotein-releasing system permease protein
MPPLLPTLLLIGIPATLFAIVAIVGGRHIVPHLIIKYLRKRRIAWVALVAVMLCTLMVLVVYSVMDGWLRMFEQSFHGLTGDVVVDAQSLTGFGHYEEMIKRIEGLDCVEAAVPTIKSFALINIANRKSVGVQVMGIQLDRIGKVNRLPQSLWRGYNEPLEASQQPGLSPEERQRLKDEAERRVKSPSFAKPLPDEEYRRLTHWVQGKGRDPAAWPGMIAGAGVLNIGRDREGKIIGRGDFLYELPVKMTVLPISPNAVSVDLADKKERNFWIVDDSRTQIWQYDSTYVYVPFEELQSDLNMQASTVTDRKTGKDVVMPARATEIHIAVRPAWKEGAKLKEARDRIATVVAAVLDEKRAAGLEPYNMDDPEVQTWRDSQRTWLDAVENEKLLTVFLFGIISLVAVFLIFCIFFMIVAEKTKDIGIIKSVGASAGGVAGIFLGYGLAIGVVGGGLGLLGGYLIVHNINEIHTAMGKFLGIQVWNPEVYLFDKIPNTMDAKEVTVIVSIAVVASVLGALLPALKAGSLNPVEALRFE